MIKKGKFIVLEGGEGAGKSSQLRHLQNHFPDAVFTREPGGTLEGEAIRGLLMDKEKGCYLTALSEMLLFAASRTQHVARVIGPALNAGKMVISDRFSPSTFAYQVVARDNQGMLGVFIALDAVSRGATLWGDQIAFELGKEHMVFPDLTIVLDVDPEVGHARVNGRGEDTTRFDDMDKKFHYAVRRGYREYGDMLSKRSDPEQVVFIDTTNQVEEDVFGEILRHIEQVSG